MCAIISGLNFLFIFLLVSETRFDRTTPTATPSETSIEKEVTQTLERVESYDVLIGTKKTFIQNLNLWSGTSRESLLSHAIRPFLLAAYPAVFGPR